MSTLKYLALSVALFSAVAAPLAAHASPIEYTLTTTASGTLGQTAFTDSALTLTFIGDTANIFPYSGLGPTLIVNFPGMESVSVAGVGTADISGTQLAVIDAPFLSAAGFFDPVSGFVLLTGAEQFASYDLTSAIGPITGVAGLLGSSTEPTSLGLLTVNSTGDTSTFTAFSPVPEPSTLALLGTGLTGLIGVARRRLKAA